MFREKAPEKAGQAYPRVVTGMGRRALVTTYEVLWAPHPSGI